MPRENQGVSLGKTAVISTAGGMVIGAIPVVSTFKGAVVGGVVDGLGVGLIILSWQTDRESSTKSYNPSGK